MEEGIEGKIVKGKEERKKKFEGKEMYDIVIGNVRCSLSLSLSLSLSHSLLSLLSIQYLNISRGRGSEGKWYC